MLIRSVTIAPEEHKRTLLSPSHHQCLSPLNAYHMLYGSSPPSGVSGDAGPMIWGLYKPLASLLSPACSPPISSSTCDAHQTCSCYQEPSRAQSTVRLSQVSTRDRGLQKEATLWRTWCHIWRPVSVLPAPGSCCRMKAALAAAVNHTPDAHSLASCPTPQPAYRVHHLYSQAQTVENTTRTM